MSAAAPTCPRCGKTLNPSALAGLCPRCLLRAALHPPETDGSGSAEARPRRFGDYEMIEEIARGGMGVVYRARQTSLNRVVAIKLLLGGEWASAEFVQRFVAEAEAAARLDHPGIVPVHEIGVHEGLHFIAMKFIEGESLAARLARPGARPSPRDAAVLIEKLARTVHHAHQRGVLHRDLKPANVLLDLRGEPVLTDFGLAKLLEHGVQLTRTHAVLGTPAYLAPETASGRAGAPTTATDVYGLGAIFHELLSSRPPFSGASPVEVLRQVVERDAGAPSAVAGASAGIDRDLDTICLKCLEKDPARRYGSAEALADDLARWLRGETIVARQSGAVERAFKWARRKPAVAALTVVLTLSLVAISVVSTVMNLRVSAAQEKLAAQAEEQRGQIVRLNVATGNRLAEEGDPLTAALWFAEAARLDARAGRNDEMHRHRIAAAWNQSPTVERLWFMTGAVVSVAFTPDGSRLLTASAGGAVRIRSVATGEDAIPPLPLPLGVESAEISPDGSRVATVGRDDQARLWDAFTGQPISEPIPLETGRRNVAFSPNNQRLAVTVKHGARLLDAATGKVIAPLLEHRTHVNHVAFSPDSLLLVTSGEDRAARIWDVATGQPAFPTIQHRGELRRAVFSPDGTRLAVADDLLAMQVYEVASGRSFGPQLQQRGLATDLRFSHDGERLLVAGDDNQARVWDVRRGEIRFSLRHHGPVRSACWSPEGDRILTASRDGTARLWRADSGEPLSGPLRESDGIVAATFSPDRKLVATASRNGMVRLWLLPAPDGTRFTVRHDGPINRLDFSPDGSRLLTAALDGNARLWNASNGAPASRLLPHLGTAGYGAFLPDGKRFLTASGQGVLHIWDAARAEELHALHHTNAFNMVGFSADGSRIQSLTVDGAIHIWDALDGRPLLRTPPGTTTSGYAELNADASRMLVHRLPSTWAVLDAATGRPLPPPLRYEGFIPCAGFSPEGHRIALADSGAKPFVRVWDCTATNWAAPAMVHDAPVMRLAWSPNGERLATATINHVVRIWSTTSGREVAAPLRHDGNLYDLRFSPDSRRLATMSADTTARIWDAATGEPLTPPLRHTTWVVQGAFNHDGTRFGTGSSDGVVRVWDVAMTTDPLDRLLDQARILSSQTWDGATSLRPLTVAELALAWEKLHGSSAAR